MVWGIFCYNIAELKDCVKKEFVMSFIENIKEKNQFPIIFVGSGITQRYFKNAPKWEELLLRLWEEVHEREAYFEEYHKLQIEGLDNFQIYLEIAHKLEKDINNAFYQRQIKIDNIEVEQAHSGNLSPFRQCIANIFSSLERRDGVDDEIKAFSKMLVKARFIVTTNYDNFIEECFKNRNVGIKVNVGNVGLFSKSNDFGELYKIHGSIKDPNTICITKDDYTKNESKLALVNAKILSNLTESPILFLGYSLKDQNIRELLLSYSDNLPFEISEAASRIGVVEYCEGKKDIQDVFSTLSDLGIYYTKISTDNYTEIYEKISQIEQGYLPSELAKFEGAFRRIIDLKGPTNDLDTVLTSFVDITKLNDEEIRNKNIVVAFGDSKYIYKLPKYEDYIHEYFAKDSTMPLDIALFFLAQKNITSPLPFQKYLKMLKKLDGIPKNIEREAELLLKRADKYSKDTLTVFSKKAEKTYAKRYKKSLDECITINEILELNIPEYNKLNYILARINAFPHEELLNFIENNFRYLKNNNWSPIFKKIVMSFSILIDE